MAIDARGFSLVPQAGGNILGGAQALQDIQQRDKAQINQERLRQLLGQGQSGIEQARQEFPAEAQKFERQKAENAKIEFDNAELKDKRDLRNHVVRIAKLQGMNPQQRIEFLNREIKAGDAAEIPMDETRAVLDTLVNRPDEADNVIREGIKLGNITGALKAGGRGAGGFQFGAQSTFKDDAGNLFFATQKRDPQSGQVQSVITSIDGTDKRPTGKLEQAGSYGLTAREKITQLGLEKDETTKSQRNTELRSDYIKQGLDAKALLPKANRLLELNQLISTGKTAKARKAFGDLFGVTDPNLGEFNSLAGGMVLGMIRQLGANPTEGERAFLEDLMPNLQAGGAVNEAIINNIINIQQRQSARAEWLIKNRAQGKDIEDYFLEVEEGDFKPLGTTAEELQDSPLETDQPAQPQPPAVKFLGFE